MRIEQVLGLLKERTSASIGEMAAEFQVSGMTIRRDLSKLARSGQVIRIPGGARIARSFGAEKTFVERLEKMAAAKDRIGRTAAGLVAMTGWTLLAWRQARDEKRPLPDGWAGALRR